MIGISRQFALLGALLLSASASLSAMQQISPQEAQLLQTEHVFDEQIAQSVDKLWERVRAVVMLWCGVAGYDILCSPLVDEAALIKGHARSSYVFGGLGLVVTLREVAAMVGDLRKVAEAQQIIAVVRQQLADLEEKRRLRRPAKMSVVHSEQPGTTDQEVTA